MANNFQTAIDYVLTNESGLVEDPHDNGGITNYGISLRTYKELASPDATADDIRILTREKSIMFYMEHYWLPAYDELFSNNICNYVFDMAVNMGPATAHKIVQRAVWALTCKPADLVDDGILGVESIHQINLWSNMLLAPLRAERHNAYKAIVAANPHLKVFYNGWIARTYK